MTLILFLDDDALTLELMQKAAQLLKHKVILCAAAETALQAVAHQRPDLIMADLSLLEMGSMNFVEKLHETPDGARIPVVTISAGRSDTDEMKSRQIGALQHLRKPLTLDRLEQILAQYTRREDGS